MQSLSTNVTYHNIGNIVAHGAKLWNLLSEQLKKEYGQVVFNNWFANLRFYDFRNGVLTLLAPSKLVREWVIANYFTKIIRLLELIDPTVQRLDVVIDNGAAKQENATGVISSVHAVSACNNVSSSLDPRFQFDTFVTGVSNKIAVAAAKQVAIFGSITEQLSIANGALYIYGNVGMGKTHLLQAIAHSIRAQYPDKMVAYMSAEKFMHQYIMSVRRNELVLFKEQLRSLDIMLLDDLQFICDKASTQKEFANTFNALIEGNRRIVLSCDRFPYNMDFDLRTRSRLASCIIVEIGHPDFDLRMEILRRKVQLMQFKLSDEIVEFIAANVTSSIRELEATLNKLIIYCSLMNNTKVTLESCQFILKDYLKSNEPDVSINKIVLAVADLYKLTKADLLSKSRLAKLVYARQVATYLAKELTTFSLQEIGRQLGGKDHATIIYYIKQFERKMERHPNIIDEVNKLKDTILTSAGRTS